MANERLADGIAACEGGNKELARRLLVEVLRSDPDNETAWLWLFACVEQAEQQRINGCSRSRRLKLLQEFDDFRRTWHSQGVFRYFLTPLK